MKANKIAVCQFPITIWHKQNLRQNTKDIWITNKADIKILCRKREWDNESKGSNWATINESAKSENEEN